MYSSPGMFVVRADSPYKTIRDLVGQPIAFGAKGSGLPILSRYMLDGLGLKQDEDFSRSISTMPATARRWCSTAGSRRLWGAGIGWPGFTAIGDQSRRRPHHRARCRRDRAHSRQALVPQAADGRRRQLSEPGTRRSIRSAPGVSSWCARACRTMWAYRLARTLHGAESCVLQEARARPARPRPPTRSPPRPRSISIHPGVLKYLREIGVAK